MSKKQIRIDDRSYRFLEALAEKHKRPISECTSMMCDVFAVMVDEIERDSKIIIETSAKEQLLPLSKLLRKPD